MLIKARLKMLGFFLPSVSFVVLWRCLCSLLIFVHLLEETSLLVLLPVGLGACTEVFGTVGLRPKNQIKVNHISNICRCGRYLRCFTSGCTGKLPNAT